MKDLLSRIPFNKKLYIKTFLVVFSLVTGGFVIAALFFGYEFTNADPFGVPVSSLLGAYIVHLMIWNPEEGSDE